MKKLTHQFLPTVVAVGLIAWTAPLAHAQATAGGTTPSTGGTADTGAAGGNNSTPQHNVNNTGGAGVSGQGNATSGGATSSTSGGNTTGGATSASAGMTSSGATTHVNTSAGLSPGDGNSGVRSTPPSGITPGTGASPNPQ